MHRCIWSNLRLKDSPWQQLGLTPRQFDKLSRTLCSSDSALPVTAVVWLENPNASFSKFKFRSEAPTAGHLMQRRAERALSRAGPV